MDATPGTVVNFAEPGLARTSDGVLHVVYTRKNGTKEELVHVAVSPGGKVGADRGRARWLVVDDPPGPAAHARRHRCASFFGGIRSTNPGETNNAMNTATAPASGAQWTLKPGRRRRRTYAYATSYAGAGLAKDGTPISTLGGHSGARVPLRRRSERARRQDPAERLLPVPRPTSASTRRAVRPGSASTRTRPRAPGLYVNAIGPGGPRAGASSRRDRVTGKNFAASPISRTSITGRIGAAGVYLAYGQGYPDVQDARALAGRHRQAAARHQGDRSEAREHRGRARRSALAHVGCQTARSTPTGRTMRRPASARPSTLRPPGSESVYELDGEGSAGPARPHRQRRPGPLAPAGVAEARRLTRRSAQAKTIVFTRHRRRRSGRRRQA